MNFYQCTPCQHAIEGCNACTQDAQNNVVCTTCDSGLTKSPSGTQCHKCSEYQFQTYDIRNKEICLNCYEHSIAGVKACELNKEGEIVPASCQTGSALASGSCSCAPGLYFEPNEQDYSQSVCQLCSLSPTHINNDKCVKCTWDQFGFTGCTECMNTHYLNADGECVTDPCQEKNYLGECIKCNTWWSSTGTEGVLLPQGDTCVKTTCTTPGYINQNGICVMNCTLGKSLPIASGDFNPAGTCASCGTDCD